MLCMYMGGAITLSDIPCEGNRVIKESKHLRKGMVRSFNLSMVFALDDAMFHTSYDTEIV